VIDVRHVATCFVGIHKLKSLLQKSIKFDLQRTLSNFQVGKVDPVPAVSLDLGCFFSNFSGDRVHLPNLKVFQSSTHSSESDFCKRLLSISDIRQRDSRQRWDHRLKESERRVRVSRPTTDLCDGTSGST